MRSTIVGSLGLVALLTLPLAAQDHDAMHAEHHPWSAVHDSVMAPIMRLFNGMRAHDSAMVRSAFAPGAMMGGVPEPGSPVRFQRADGFVTAVGSSAGGAPWNERIYDPEIQIDGGLATVWTFYTFSLGDKFSHCGVDAFQVVRTGEGWQVIFLSDSRRSTNCDTAGKVEHK